MNTTYDTTGWTIYEPAEFECIDAYTGNSRTTGGIKPVFILELYNEQKQITITKFFNCKKTKKENLAVNKNSDFACIYRASVGEDPRPRYSKAKQLLHHLIGVKFLCEYEEAKDRNGSLYFRAKEIQPVEPKTCEDWFLNGKLKNKRGARGRGHLPSRSGLNKQIIPEQRPDISVSTIRQKFSNELENGNPANTIDCNASGAISSTYQHPTLLNSSIESLQHEYYVDIDIVSDRERVFRYSSAPNVKEDDYHYLVIDDSLTRW